MNKPVLVMIPTKLAVIMPVMLILAILFLAPIASADGTKIPFTGSVDGYEIPTPYIQMCLNQTTGIIETKGGTISGNFTTDYAGLNGTFTMIYNSSFNLLTGNGTMYGTITFDDGSGNTFEGIFWDFIYNGLFISGEFAADGTGVYTGSKMNGTYSGMWDPNSLISVEIPYCDGSGALNVTLPIHVTATFSGDIYYPTQPPDVPEFGLPAFVMLSIAIVGLLLFRRFTIPAVLK